MKIATYNVNSVRARLPNLLEWLARAKPDVACLQELKCQEEQFPFEALKEAGYDAHVVGQKAYNGVAILSRHATTIVGKTIDDDQSRYIEATINGIRIINIYAPNGNPIGTPKFEYKLDWLKRLEARMKQLIKEDVPFVVTGDFNIIPESIDADNPDSWKNDALFQPEARAAYRRMLNLGLTDALRMHFPNQPNLYTFWDYFANAFARDHGIRIDHFLLSPHVADHCTQAGIDKSERGKEKASDHTPVWISISMPS